MIQQFQPPFAVETAARDTADADRRAAEASDEAAEDRRGGAGRLHAFGRFAVGRLSAADVLREAAGVPDASRPPAEPRLLLLICPGEARYSAGALAGTAAAGDILCFDLSESLDLAFAEPAAIALVVPRSLCRLAPDGIEALHGALVEGAAPLGRVFAGQLALVAEAAPGLGPSEGEALAESVGVLAAAILGAALPPAAALATDLPLAAILAFIDGNLARTDLSPTMIGRQFGLSRSALYRLFEPVGGIAAAIRERRLERARRHIAAMGEGRGGVGRLASAVGFPSDAAFARAFRQRYGMAPSTAISAATSASRAARVERRH